MRGADYQTRSETMTKTLSGVQFNAPPPGPIMASVNRIALDAAANLPPGTNGGIFGIVTDKGVNGVIVQRYDGEKVDFTVVGYIAKKWGEPNLEAGAVVQVTW